MSGGNPDLDTVMSRIVKLLALSKSSNPHEAAAAAEKASELMFAYNLSLAQVEAAGEKTGRKRYGLQEIRLGSGVGLNWRRRLLSDLGELNFCRCYYWSGTRSAEILGRKHNLEMVEHLYRYLEREISRLAESGAAIRDFKWMSSTGWKNNFGHGAVDIIVARLYQKRDQLAATPEARALVPVISHELEEEENRLKIKTRKEKIRPGNLPEQYGYAEGVLAGRKVRLDEALGDGEERRRLAAAGVEQGRMAI